jgi:hypothetical protein
MAQPCPGIDIIDPPERDGLMSAIDSRNVYVSVDRH